MGGFGLKVYLEVAGHLRGAGEVDKLLLPVSRGGSCKESEHTPISKTRTVQS